MYIQTTRDPISSVRVQVVILERREVMVHGLASLRGVAGEGSGVSIEDDVLLPYPRVLPG